MNPRRVSITLFSALLLLFFSQHSARAQFAVIDAQNATNQIMSYIQDAENALQSIEGIAQVFESMKKVHAALEKLQQVYDEVSPIIRDTKAVADIAINYARVVEDWDKYYNYISSLDGASYNEIKYAFYWGTRLVKNAAEDFEYARKLISSKSLRMDDYQRYSQLQQLAGHLASIHRSFSGNLERKQKQAASRKAMDQASGALRSIMN